MAIAVIGPLPGIVMRRDVTPVRLAAWETRFSRSEIRVSGVPDLIEIKAAQIDDERIEGGRNIVGRQGELLHVGRSLRCHDTVLSKMAA